MSNDDHLRYPIGKFSPQESYTRDEIISNIERIASLPARVESLVRNFSDAQLDMTYREGGWTARQVLHHLPDSHVNAYIRCKWTLTEDTPLIKAYNEKLWAETPEAKLHPSISVDLLQALHIKWTTLLNSLTPADFRRQFIHPETKAQIGLDRQVALYAWHGEHHLGHLKIIAARPTSPATTGR